MYKKIYLGLAIAAIFSVFIFVSSVSCFAQGPGQGQGQGQQGQGQGQEQGRGQMPAWLSAGDDMAKAFMEEEDKDKNGKVSKDEFSGPDNIFESWDKNGDGSIEASEAPTAESMQGMGGRGGGEGGGQGGAQQGGAPGGQAGSGPPAN